MIDVFILIMVSLHGHKYKYLIKACMKMPLIMNE